MTQPLSHREIGEAYKKLAVDALHDADATPVSKAETLYLLRSNTYASLAAYHATLSLDECQ